jgi:hypothetical protein
MVPIDLEFARKVTTFFSNIQTFAEKKFQSFRVSRFQGFMDKKSGASIDAPP